jgi:hypothetical protein
MPNCIKCGRALSDPTSVKRGYGPECWGAIQESGQLGFFDDPALKSDFDYRIDIDTGIVVLVITDLNRGGMSVTNNMPAIFAHIEKAESCTVSLGSLIIYRDSEGEYNGVLGNGNFYPLAVGKRITNEQEALKAIRGSIKI